MQQTSCKGNWYSRKITGRKWGILDSRPEFWLWFCHYLTVCTSASHSISQSLSFLIYQYGKFSLLNSCSTSQMRSWQEEWWFPCCGQTVEYPDESKEVGLQGLLQATGTHEARRAESGCLGNDHLYWHQWTGYPRWVSNTKWALSTNWTNWKTFSIPPVLSLSSPVSLPLCLHLWAHFLFSSALPIVFSRIPSSAHCRVSSFNFIVLIIAFKLLTPKCVSLAQHAWVSGFCICHVLDTSRFRYPTRRYNSSCP